nr:hypothetical protein [Klebsiella pneumoniae]
MDGVLIANTEIVDAASNNFEYFSRQHQQQKWIQKLDSALKNLLEKRSRILFYWKRQAAILFPWSAICGTPQVSLKAFLSLVDTVMLNDDYDGGKKLIPVFQEHPQQRDPGVESLLAEQIMFCNKLLLTKTTDYPSMLLLR